MIKNIKCYFCATLIVCKASTYTDVTPRTRGLRTTLESEVKNLKQEITEDITSLKGKFQKKDSMKEPFALLVVQFDQQMQFLIKTSEMVFITSAGFLLMSIAFTINVYFGVIIGLTALTAAVLRYFDVFSINRINHQKGQEEAKKLEYRQNLIQRAQEVASAEGTTVPE